MAKAIKISKNQRKQVFQDALDEVLDDIHETAMDRIWGKGNVRDAMITIYFKPNSLVTYDILVSNNIPKALYEIGDGDEDSDRKTV